MATRYANSCPLSSYQAARFPFPGCCPGWTRSIWHLFFLAKDSAHQGQARSEGLAGAIQSIRTHAAGEEQVQQTLAGTVQSLSRQPRRNLFSKVRDKQGKGGRGRIRQGSRGAGVCTQVPPSQRVYSILSRLKPLTVTQS